jgi:CRP/FNR family transcriptional regulator
VPTAPVPLPRQDIGDYLGLTIATVSQTLHRLDCERAILIMPNGVRLLDLARLEHLAES